MKNIHPSYDQYCDSCGASLMPIWFTEEEVKYINGAEYKTGRKRRACSHLVCTVCGANYPVDDTFDGEWR